MTPAWPYFTDEAASQVRILGHGVSAYLVFAHLGFMVGCTIALRRASQHRFSERLLVLTFACIYLSAVIGARALSVIADGYWPHYAHNPRMIIQLWRGGYVFYGGLLGAAFAAWCMSRALDWSIAKLADLCAAGTALGVSIARVGCFVQGCCFGKPTTWPTGIEYHNFALHVRPIGVPLHPSPLYETAILVPIAFWLARRTRLPGAYPGSSFLAFLVLYGLGRFVIEFTRADARGSVGPFSTSQFISLILIGWAAAKLASSHRRRSQIDVAQLPDSDRAMMDDTLPTKAA